jgi:hypothetical protein
MALVLADRVRETTTVVGTGTATLLGAVAGYQSFTAVGNANTTYYVIASQAANEWEVGIGTYTASGTTLSRDTVLSSSNAGALVNFTAGTKDIWVDYTAGKAVTTDTLAYPPEIGGTTPNAATFTTLTATGQTSLGGAAGAETVRVNTGTNTGKYTLLESIAASNVQLVGAAGTSNLGLYSTGGGTIRFYTAPALQAQQLNIAHTASAVNFVQVTGAATNNRPTASSQGSDTDIGFNIVTKGSGTHNFASDANIGTSQFQVTRTQASAVNYLTATGAATNFSPRLFAAGSDTNISQVFQSKGTGAINLAPGSSGVNISNGGTVTAITATVSGTGYTSIPSVAVSAPTTAGGVQATASALMFTSTATVQSGGTGYTNGDVLTIVGGTTGGAVGTYTVTGVSGGVITSVSRTTGSGYSVLPSNPVSTTGGTGSGATLNLTWTVSGFTITNAGSGYVEQPTVTFSGGGGSGAAAYATVGSGSVIRALGTTGTQGIDFHTAASVSNNAPVLRLRDFSTGTSTNSGFVVVTNANLYTQIIAQGPANTNLNLSANGSGSVSVCTNGFNETQQLRVAHTASAVNFVQVTGAATGGGLTTTPRITSQGSDANIALQLEGKGNGEIRLASHRTNYLAVSGSGSAGGLVTFTAAGGDTNIDLALTPKGTGNVRFGTYTANMALTIQGYVEIKDSGGTIRRLAVIA